MDEEELAEATAQINRELYVFEDRVAVLEAAPAAVGGGTATYTLLGSGSLVFNNRQFNFEAAEAAAIRAAWDVSHRLELRFTLSAGRYVTSEIRTIPQPVPATAIQVYAGIATSDTGQPRVGVAVREMMDDSLSPERESAKPISPPHLPTSA